MIVSDIYHVNVADYHHYRYSTVPVFSFVAKGTCTVHSPVTNAEHV